MDDLTQVGSRYRAPQSNTMKGAASARQSLCLNVNLNVQIHVLRKVERQLSSNLICFTVYFQRQKNGLIKLKAGARG